MDTFELFGILVGEIFQILVAVVVVVIYPVYLLSFNKIFDRFDKNRIVPTLTKSTNGWLLFFNISLLAPVGMFRWMSAQTHTHATSE